MEKTQKVWLHQLQKSGHRHYFQTSLNKNDLFRKDRALLLYYFSQNHTCERFIQGAERKIKNCFLPGGYIGDDWQSLE